MTLKGADLAVKSGMNAQCFSADVCRRYSRYSQRLYQIRNFKHIFMKYSQSVLVLRFEKSFAWISDSPWNLERLQESLPAPQPQTCYSSLSRSHLPVSRPLPAWSSHGSSCCLGLQTQQQPVLLQLSEAVGSPLLAQALRGTRVIGLDVPTPMKWKHTFQHQCRMIRVPKRPTTFALYEARGLKPNNSDYQSFCYQCQLTQEFQWEP